MSLRAEIHKKLGAFSLDISLETQGGVLGLLGASGCGKSMTLKCIAGIEKPDSGYIAEPCYLTASAVSILHRSREKSDICFRTMRCFRI